MGINLTDERLGEIKEEIVDVTTEMAATDDGRCYDITLFSMGVLSGIEFAEMGERPDREQIEVKLELAIVVAKLSQELAKIFLVEKG